MPKPAAILSDFSAELAEAIDTASISRRGSTGDAEFESEERVMVLCITLGSPFIFTREAAEQRIRAAFPELSNAGVARGIRHIETRIRAAYAPTTDEKRRKSWVMGWAE